MSVSHTSLSWSCYFSLLDIHPSAVRHHSRCARVPPSGISHLPLASTLRHHRSPPCLLHCFSTVSSDFIHQSRSSIISSLLTCPCFLCHRASLLLFQLHTVWLGDLLSSAVSQNRQQTEIEISMSYFDKPIWESTIFNWWTIVWKLWLKIVLSQAALVAWRVLSFPGSSFQTRSSLTSRAAAPSHRIKDRDYLGWMDFGRRSAEEYEYSP